MYIVQLIKCYGEYIQFIRNISTLILLSEVIYESNYHKVMHFYFKVFSSTR